jgi:transcription initiation factor IIE alpha subunit
MRESLLEFGCPVCGADVEPLQFTTSEQVGGHST